MTIPGFVARNILRNPRRTFLTVISVGVSLGLVMVLQTLITEIMRPMDDMAQAARIVVRHRVSLGNYLPRRYRYALRNLPGVDGVTPLQWFGGIFKDDRPENMFARFAVEPTTFFQVFTDVQPTKPEYVTRFLSERRGCLVGTKLPARYGWKIGDRITLKGDIYPVDIEVILVGTFTGLNDDWMVFNEKYLEEALGRTYGDGTIWLKAESYDAVPQIISSVEKLFRNSDAPVRCETEKAFYLSFIEMMGNIQLFIGGLVSTVVFAVLLVAASTMAMTVRERMPEIAVLKTLGFRPAMILKMVVGEGIVVSGLGGLIGVGGTYVVLPRPQWFMAIAGGCAVFGLITAAGIMLGLMLPESLSASGGIRLALARFQRQVWKWGPWVAVAGGGLTTLLLFGSVPPLDWYAFSRGFIQADMRVMPETITLGAVLAAVIGLGSSLLPAWTASRIKILDGLRFSG